MPASDLPICFLFDNGSLRAASTRNLRVLADALGDHIGARVEPVSLLHSTAVPESELGGRRARLLESALDTHWAEGGRDVVLLPLFFGASAALTDFVPARLSALRAKWPARSARLARPLVDLGAVEDSRLARALADGVRTTMAQAGLTRPSVLLVDHGSPQPVVTEVREFLSEQLRRELAEITVAVGTASMERREGDEYAFNEPLLARALRTAPFNTGNVVVALQFLSPGRHAGPGGDVAEICASAEAGQPGLHTFMTEPLGAHPFLIEVLADRYREVIKPVSLAR